MGANDVCLKISSLFAFLASLLTMDCYSLLQLLKKWVAQLGMGLRFSYHNIM
ncbi:MAG: hypothetical protein ACKO34_02805 [Vampirovibrionales bacterium]